MADEVEVVVIEFSELAKDLEGEEFYEQPVVYTFGGRREFKDKGEDSALYNP